MPDAIQSLLDKLAAREQATSAGPALGAPAFVEKRTA